MVLCCSKLVFTSALQGTALCRKENRHLCRCTQASLCPALCSAVKASKRMRQPLCRLLPILPGIGCALAVSWVFWVAVSWGLMCRALLQDKEAACPGADSGQPAVCGLAELSSTSANARTLPGGMVTFAQYTDKFIDDRTLNGSRVGIVNNVGFTAAAAGMNEATGTWTQCLQGSGEFTKNRICDNSW